MSQTGKAIFLVVLGLIIVGSGLATDSFSSMQGVGTLVGAWLTICVLSFLFRDNPFYRFAEHLMVGLAMGYFAIYYAFQILEAQWYDRLFKGDLYDSEVIFGSQAIYRYALVIPAIGGLLMLTRVFPKIGWLSRWSMALVIGIGSGIAIPWTIQANITTQLLVASKLPARYMTALWENPGATEGIPDLFLWEVGVPVLIVGTVCALIYFFFSVPHRGIIGKAATLGIWVLMLGFGTSFGLTVMARLSLFIGRIIYIFKNWLDVPWLT
jgi:hypothetical protein